MDQRMSMDRFKTMPPDIYECWCNNLKIKTDDLLSQIQDALLQLAEDLISMDIPGILPNIYRISDRNGNPIPTPTLRRDDLNRLDPDQQLIGRLKKLQNHWMQLPDKDFVPAMEQWLREKSPDQQRQLLKRCLKKMDVQGTSKLIRFTAVGKNPVLPRMAKEKYGLSEPELVSNLVNYSEVRNEMNHVNDEGRSRLQPEKLYQNLENLIRQLRGCSHPAVSQQAADCMELLKEYREALSLEPLQIRQLEEKHGFPQDTLGTKLKRNSLYRPRLNKAATVLVATWESDIEPLLGHIKASEHLAKETGAGDPEPEAIASEPMPTVGLELPAYTAGKFSTPQLKYFVDHFSLLADAGTLLSRDGLDLIANVLVPMLAACKKRLQVDWSTLVYIYRMEKEAADASLRETAKLARHQIYHLQHMGHIRYVGSAYGDPDPRESLVQLLQANRTEPVCVITTDKELAARVSTEATPLVLCLGLWGKRGFALRSECAARYADYGRLPLEEPRTAPVAPSPDIEGPAAGPAPVSTFPEAVPGAHDMVLDEKGVKLMLLKVKGQPGGEGAVYTTTRAGQVAKIYHADKLTQERLDKLTAMRAVRLDMDSVCWPTSLLYNQQHQFVGFLMASAPEDAEELGSSVMKLGGKSVSQEKMPNWDRSSIVRCAVSVCRTFEMLHRSHILMGDVNPRNIMVSISDPGRVYFVDCDSYQVGRFNCPVGMTEYSSPEMLRRVSVTPGGYAACPRTAKDENFALATLLFKMLMLGQSPFAAKNAGNQVEAIRDYSFAFKSENVTGYDAPDGPAPLIWSNTPKHLKEKFAQVFLGQQDYDADLWGKEFEYYLKKLEDGTYTKLLRPLKYPDFTGDLFEDFTCAHCGVEANMTKEQFKKLSSQPKFCRACYTTVRRSRNIPQKVRCDACGLHKDAFVYDQIMQDYGKKWYCAACRTATCADCGKTFALSPRNIERRRQGNLPTPWCSDCFKKREESKKWK